MGRQLRYHALFDCDVREAAGWYDRRADMLGDRFVSEVRDCVEKITADPERFALSSSGCRYVRLNHFPYVVLFDAVGDELLLLGVLHTARSMDKWRERTEDV